MLAEEARKKFKKKKASRLVGLLEKCMQHGGPVTDKNVGILDGLTTDQLKLEMSVLKQAVSETVRSKYKVTVEGGKNYFKTGRSRPGHGAFWPRASGHWCNRK